MYNSLDARLAKLESRFPVARLPRRFLRVVSGEGHDDEMERLAAVEGFGVGDVLIHRLIIAPPGRPRVTIPARILSRSPHHVR